MFKYTFNSMHIQKVLEHSWYPETKNYTYRGNLLTHMEVVYTYLHEDEHTDSINLFYDVPFETAKAISNGETYTNSHNLPSDIVGIVDSIGMLMVEYGCDAWGETMSITGFWRICSAFGIYSAIVIMSLMRRRGCAAYGIVIMRKVTYIPF